MRSWMTVTNRNDGFSVTAPVGSFRSNAWGLHDMHGNAAEWTLTAVDAGGEERRLVKGGSFFDPPRRVPASSRLAYPQWQRVFNVGFRVVLNSADQ